MWAFVGWDDGEVLGDGLGTLGMGITYYCKVSGARDA